MKNIFKSSKLVPLCCHTELVEVQWRPTHIFRQAQYGLAPCYILLIFFLFILFSCSSPQKNSGFTKTPSGLYYHLHSFGDGKINPQNGDLLELKIRINTLSDSVLYNSDFFEYKFDSASIFSEGLGLMREGDSATFIFPANKLFSRLINIDFKNEDTLKAHVKILKIIPGKNINYLTEEADLEEQEKIRRYVGSTNSDFRLLKNGIYCLPINEGQGDLVIEGNKISVKYTGYFLDGRQFDTNYNNWPFEFVLGEPDQLIPGLEKVIYYMRRGEKAKFIIPSQLAFGAEGSTNGTVPPYTTVIYELELLTVN